MSVTILGIESSCDDTSSSVIRDGVMLSNVIASQAVHEAYGGVVPELASRAHQQNIIPVVAEAIKRAGIDKSELSAVAFTRGPGLMGSLLVGTSFAKGLAASLDIPRSTICRRMCWPISSRRRRKTIMLLRSRSFACWYLVGTRRLSR